MKHLKSLALVLLFFACNISAVAQKQKIWIDADTGNETDDIYAILRLLEQPGMDVIGLSSAHFNNSDLVAFKKWNQYQTGAINTVLISQKLNEELLLKSNKSFIAHPIGADRQMGRSWGGRQPRDSPAARNIISSVKQLNKNEKLVIICLGALTNIASAIAIDTSITSHLTCYALGAQYNIDKACWNKNEFNIRNDLNAFDYLLDDPKLDLTVMPINVARYFTFKRDSLFAIFNMNSPVQIMLKKRWEETNPGDTIRTLWDLALVEAYLNPNNAVVKQVKTPPENTERTIRVYTAINVAKLKSDFIETLKTEK